MNDAISVSTPAHVRLANFPVAFFSVVMGLGGLSLAWLKAHHLLGMPLVVGAALRFAATVLYVLIAATYLGKLLRHPQAVRDEMAHPVRQNFFPAISIGLMLLATAWADTQPQLARLGWHLGAGLQLIFTLSALNGWIHRDHYRIVHVSPAWFIPVVGNILAPIGGMLLAAPDAAWFFFSIGLLFWLVLLTIVVYRLVFHEALPPAQMPTLFILIAPPALGFISYMALVGRLDAFARILYFSALFMLLLLFSNAPRFLRLPYFLSAWAYSFPLAAMAVATLVMAEASQSGFYRSLSLVLLGVVSAVIAMLSISTVEAMRHGRICVAEKAEA